MFFEIFHAVPLLRRRNRECVDPAPVCLSMRSTNCTARGWCRSPACCACCFSVAAGHRPGFADDHPAENHRRGGQRENSARKIRLTTQMRNVTPKMATTSVPRIVARVMSQTSSQPARHALRAIEPEQAEQHVPDRRKLASRIRLPSLMRSSKNSVKPNPPPVDTGAGSRWRKRPPSRRDQTLSSRRVKDSSTYTHKNS